MLFSPSTVDRKEVMIIVSALVFPPALTRQRLGAVMAGVNSVLP